MNTNPSWTSLQKWSVKKQNKVQNTKLTSIIQLLDLSPYYHSLFKTQNIDIDKIKSTDDLKKLPFTTKQDIVSTIENKEKASAFVINPTKQLSKLPKISTMKLFFSGNLKSQLIKEFKPVHVHFTTGTTATSIPVLYTQHDLSKLRQAAQRIMQLINIPTTARVVNAFPFAPHLAFWQTVYATNEIGIFGLHTGGGKVMGTTQIMSMIEHMQAEALTGMPSYIYHIATEAKARDFNNLKYIILGGEAIVPGFVDKLKTLLKECNAHVQVYSTYAFTEGKVAWIQCNENSGYHLYPDMEFIEIIDEAGNRVADGSMGEIVYTGLDFRGTAFLRYKTGDYGSLEVGSCQYCKAKTQRISQIITRAHELRKMNLTKVKGTLVDFNAVKAFLSSFPHILEWQIILQKKMQHGMDEVLLFVAIEKGKNKPYIQKEIIREMRSRFNITPTIIIKKKAELVEMLGFDTKLKQERIIDKRQ